MYQSVFCRSLAVALLGGLLLSACGGNSNSTTNTPTSTLGTDSAAAKVGGIPADTATTATPMGTGH